MLCNSFNENSKFPLVIVGNWDSSSYGKEIRRTYQYRSNLVLLDAIYEQRELNLLRGNCLVYLHGHSAGGTNPALVEAMSLNLPVFAFDNVFNRYTTENRAVYFTDSISLQKKILNISEDELNQNQKDMVLIANTNYRWKHVCDVYAKIFNS